MMRRWIAVAAVVGGLALMVLPYRYQLRLADGQAVVHVGTGCLPIRDAFKKVPDGGYFGYAPGVGASSLDSAFCSPTARARLAVGMISLVAGVALLAWDYRGRLPGTAAA
jgi:hypothetical protein